ncbi:MAG: protein kinase, partial [Deltaproteobacteria bacterium]|nr:protein kinase [Deltaproteobacteria bacterium]
MSDKKEIDQTLPLSGHVKDCGHAPVSADEFTLPLVESESAAGNGGAENIFDEQTLALVPQTVSLAGPQSPDVRTVLFTPANRQDTKAIVPLAWQAGDVILDLYEVRGVFGEGATATVYKVFHRDWNLELAVKSPLPAVLKMAGWAENFEQEAETWVNLGLHPHCVSCYYVRRLGGVPRLFAECVDGGDLHAWIVNGTLYRDGPEVALARMIDIAIQFAWGLQHAHDQGLVHQDVKPANVMMTANGIAKVTDFGLAKAHSIVDERVAAGGGKPQNSAATCGGMTPAYCSPEQARIVRKAQEGVPLDRCGKLTPASDIWSWAVAVFEMFAREPIWKRGEMADTGLDHFLKSGTPDAAAPAMPTGLVTVLRKCLNRNPVKRPASLQLIAEELQLVYRETAGSAYFRPVPKSAEALADSLNNRAVSLLDLGRLEEAGSCWEKALELHPNHPESTVNAGLTRWRNGTIHDTELVRRVSEVRGAYGNDWKCDHLISLIHLERGRFDEALQLLNNLTGADRTSTEIKQTTDIAQQRCASSRRLQETLSGHASAVNSVWLSDDGSKVLSGSGAPFAFARQKDYSVRLWEARSGACLYTLQG